MGKLADLFKGLISNEEKELNQPKKTDEQIGYELSNDIGDNADHLKNFNLNSDTNTTASLLNNSLSDTKLNPLYQQLKQVYENTNWIDILIPIKTSIEQLFNKSNIELVDLDNILNNINDISNNNDIKIENENALMTTYKNLLIILQFYKKTLSELETFKNTTIQEKEMTYENISESESLLLVTRLNELLSEIINNKDKINLSSELISFCNEYYGSTKDFLNKSAFLFEKIKEFKEEEDALRREIITFSSIVKKYSSSFYKNDANVQNQLKTQHEQLTVKRSSFLDDTTQLNIYVNTLNNSFSKLFEKFVPNSFLLIEELKFSFIDFQNSNKDGFLYDPTKSDLDNLNMLKNDITNLKNKIITIKKINEKFSV